MDGSSLNGAVRLSEEQKEQIAARIRAFYSDVRGEEIGMAEERQIMDLFCEHLAPVVYDKALDDTRRWLKEQLEALKMIINCYIRIFSIDKEK